MTPSSLLPEAAAAVGISYPELCAASSNFRSPAFSDS